MNIKHPELIPMLVLIPALIAFLYFTFNKRLNALKQLCKSTKLSSIFPMNSNFKLVLRYSLICIAFSLLVIAFISPRWGYDWKPVETKGTNIYIALDVSRSMLAEDISPNRLVRAKHELSKLIDKLTGDRVGLIIFAGESFLQAPLTHDYLMIKEWLSKIDINYVPVAGTSMKSAIDLAVKGFEHIESDSKAIILISDGEEHSEEAEDKALFETVKKAMRQKIKIYSIGIGTNKGAPIRYNGELIKDKNDNVVVSKLNGTLLKSVAEMSKGYYVRSSTGDFHIDNLYYEHLKKNINAETLKSGKTKLWYETYQIFTGIAFALLLIELLLTFDLGILALIKLIFMSIVKLFKMILRIKDKPKDIFSAASKGKAKHEAAKKKSAALTIALFILLSSAPAAQANIFDINLLRGDHYLQEEDFEQAQFHYLPLQAENPHNPRLNYNLGITHYRDADYEKALHSFELSSLEADSELLKEKALYNLGNAHFKLEDYKSAITAYEGALEILPDDEDAQHNLELAKEKLEEQENPDGDDKGDESEDQDGDGDKDSESEQDKQKEDQGDQEKDQDQNKDQDKKQDKQNQDKQPKPENPNQDKNNGGGGSGGAGQKPQPRLSPQQVDNLLKQVQEADAGQVQQQRMNSQQNVPGRVNINPW